MVARETPTIATAAYASATYGGNALTGVDAWEPLAVLNEYTPEIDTAGLRGVPRHQNMVFHDRRIALGDQGKAMLVGAMAEVAAKMQNTNQEKAVARRVVQVYIVDPNENVPVDKCLLYKGEPQLTDLTDQELFFDIDMKGILTKHNEYRVTVVDKTVKDRTQHLEAARIRDLKMVVALLAAF